MPSNLLLPVQSSLVANLNQANLAHSEDHRVAPAPDRASPGKWLARIAPLAYGLVGFFLIVDLHCVPWSASFWIVFGPLLAASELAIRQLSR